MPGIGVNLRVTGYCNQGGRKYMEDMFSVAYQQTPDMKDLEYAFFGIFDGHGGSEAAAYAKDHLLDTIIKDDAFWSKKDEDVLRAIRNGYVNTHIEMWKNLGMFTLYKPLIHYVSLISCMCYYSNTLTICVLSFRKMAKDSIWFT